MRVTTAVGDSRGQMWRCQKDSASPPAQLPGEGRGSLQTMPLPTQHVFFSFGSRQLPPAHCAWLYLCLTFS